jgi:hypothetical protein
VWWWVVAGTIPPRPPSRSAQFAVLGLGEKTCPLVLGELHLAVVVVSQDDTLLGELGRWAASLYPAQGHDAANILTLHFLPPFVVMQ